jgi:hypothetical protein
LAEEHRDQADPEFVEDARGECELRSSDAPLRPPVAPRLIGRPSDEDAFYWKFKSKRFPRKRFPAFVAVRTAAGFEPLEVREVTSSAPGTTTPKGVGVGSKLSAVKRAYPGAQCDRHSCVLTTAGVPGWVNKFEFRNDAPGNQVFRPGVVSEVLVYVSPARTY